MIDIATEQLIALADVPKHLPKRRGGKRVSLSCVYRWAQRGLHGVRLEVLPCGGTKCTSLPAIQRFFDRLAAVASGEAVVARTSKQRQRDSDKANAELAKAGW